MLLHHPCDALTGDEIELCTKTVASQFIGGRNSLIYSSVSVVEPCKEEVWEYDQGLIPKPPREIQVIVIEKPSQLTYEVFIELQQEDSNPQPVPKVLQKILKPSVQPSFVAGEYQLAESIVKNDPKLQAWCLKHNILLTDIVVECWACGWFHPEDNPHQRLVRPLLYLRNDSHEASNPYGRPLDGFLPIVDLIHEKVVDWYLFDEHLVIPDKDEAAEFDRTFFPLKKRRKNVSPLIIHQPRGPSYEIQGNHIQWQGFHFRISFTQREGLVLQNIHFQNRPVVYRLSFNEMVVPYGDPLLPNVRKNAFDAGEDGLGNSANSLLLGCDCIGYIRYLNAFVVDRNGFSVLIENAICIHEDDEGVLWTHTDWRTGKKELRRNRRLVIQMTSTIANYDYVFSFFFRLDGTIETSVKMTGILSTSIFHPQKNMIYNQNNIYSMNLERRNDERKGELSASAPYFTPVYGTLIAPQLVAPIHQHFFIVRIDMAVDGARNRVEEIEVVSSPLGYENPCGNAFRTQRTLLMSEQQSGRDSNSKASRAWIVSSEAHRNRLGERTAYKLMPSHDVHPFAHKTSPVMQRASFLRHNLWITQTDNVRRRFVSGDYPNQRASPDGVTEWIKDDLSLVDKELTLWYTLGFTHVVAPEQWPVMTAERISFMLQPHGFFDRNPTLDTHPPEENFEEFNANLINNGHLRAKI